MHVVGTVVNPKCQLIGLIISGEEREFGGVSKELVQRRVPIGNIPNGFSTQELSVNNGVITLNGTFRLSHLSRMEILVGDNCHPVDNRIELTKAFANGGDIVGFAVKFGDGTIKNLTNADLAEKASYFRPTNFVVKSINGKNVICGKPGVMTIDQLPLVDLSDDRKSKRNGRMKPQSNLKPLEEYTPVSGVVVDILSIYDYIKESHGYIVKLPSEKYKTNGSGAVVDYNGFKVQCGVEVASPTPKYGDKKINATLSFRKAGVAVGESGKEYETFAYTSKSVFADGENRMGHIGVLISPDRAGYFKNPVFNAKQIEDAEIMAGLQKLVNVDNRILLEVDITKVGLIADDRRKNCILTNEQIKELSIKLYSCKLMLKYLSNRGELMKSINKKLGNQKYAELVHGGVNQKYKGMTADELADIKSAGINIITGEYQKYQIKEETASDASSNENDDIYIEYIYAGLDYTKVTGKQMVEMAAVNDTNRLPDNMIEVINAIEHEPDCEKKLALAKPIQDKLEVELDAISRKLWEHRAAMFLDGRKKYIHTHDSASWVPDEKSRAKKYNVYVNTDFNDLTIRFRGVAIQ